MKRSFAFIIIIAVVFLAGCHGSGSSAPAPTNVNVIAGDTSVTVSWDMLPGVEYWAFKAAGTSVSPQSCIAMPECNITAKAVSPMVFSGLTNGTTYSFTVNGRIDGGKGGPGSPSIMAVPRLAGATWSVGASLGAKDLHGVAFGSVFVAAGNSGALFSSPDGINWTPSLTNPILFANLNAVSYSGGKYVVVGAGGVVLLSTDGATWQQQTSGTINDLYAIANNGVGGFVATGLNGTIITSSDGIIWKVITPVTTSALYGITYGNGKYVAAGVAGTLFTSADGATWQTVTPLSTFDLKSVAYGAGMFAALGANGTLVTSPDGISWTLQTAIAPSALLNAVTYGRQFVATDNIGGTYVSIDGLAWSRTQSSSNLPVYAVTHGLYDYVAVGAIGSNMHSM